jgi:hypothetical protein
MTKYCGVVGLGCIKLRLDFEGKAIKLNVSKYYAIMFMN